MKWFLFSLKGCFQIEYLLIKSQRDGLIMFSQIDFLSLLQYSTVFRGCCSYSTLVNDYIL